MGPAGRMAVATLKEFEEALRAQGMRQALAILDKLRERDRRTRKVAPARRIAPPLRARVRFAELNLMATPYPVDRDLDVIFLRNVLIYFDSPTQERVLAAMASHLRPGGHLVVGHSESMTVRLPGLRHVAPAVYERAPGAKEAA